MVNERLNEIWIYEQSLHAVELCAKFILIIHLNFL